MTAFYDQTSWESMKLKDQSVYVAGHSGLAGSAICRRLRKHGVGRIVSRSHNQLDLGDARAVARFFNSEPIDYVILAAGRVGGIHANNAYPAEFIYQNLMIESNVIHQAFLAGIRRLLFLGSSCIYPKHARQPMKEEYLLTGSLEPTNAPYAVAKIAGIQMCEAYNRQYDTRYRAMMPTNLYGPNDNFDLENAHVLPAMMRKFHLAEMVQRGNLAAVAADIRRFGPIPESLKHTLGMVGGDAANPQPWVELWGTGASFREFMFVDDMADACVFLMELADDRFDAATASFGFPFVNVGCGRDITVKELAKRMAAVVGYTGKVVWDRNRPDGTPKKLLDVSRLSALGWSHGTTIEEGIRSTYEWYKTTVSESY